MIALKPETSLQMIALKDVDIAGNESEYGIPATTLADWAASVDWS